MGIGEDGEGLGHGVEGDRGAEQPGEVGGRGRRLDHHHGVAGDLAAPAVGEGADPGPRDEDGEYIKMDIESGDEIIFSKYGGTEIKLGTDDYLILRESDVLTKVVGDREPAGATA